MKQTKLIVLGICLCAVVLPLLAAPEEFEQAKLESREFVYHDQTGQGTFYCGCEWHWVGRSGGRVNHASCGYALRAQKQRAIRTEWEHIVPASNFGRARQCWQDGGRRNCQRSDPMFSLIEADMHNLTPAVGEINADRSNYNFNVLPGAPRQHGACDFKVDFKRRAAEPRDQVKGQVARTYFYMHDRYDLPMSIQQQRLFMAWDRQFPVSAWERERDRRIAQRMGHHNAFVTGGKQWIFGPRNSSEGLLSGLPAHESATSAAARASASATVRGNRNSSIYHLAEGCPSYERVSERNRVEFETEDQAVAAGFRKAGNCR